MLLRRPDQTRRLRHDAWSDLLVRRLSSFPERIGGLVVAAAAAEEHQRHQAASDEKRKERAEPKGDPAVPIHHDVACGVPYGRRPDAGEDKQGHQDQNERDLSGAKS